MRVVRSLPHLTQRAYTHLSLERRLSNSKYTKIVKNTSSRNVE